VVLRMFPEVGKTECGNVLTALQLMYRAKKDGPALMGWKHPWDH